MARVKGDIEVWGRYSGHITVALLRSKSKESKESNKVRIHSSKTSCPGPKPSKSRACGSKLANFKILVGGAALKPNREQQRL